MKIIDLFKSLFKNSINVEIVLDEGAVMPQKKSEGAAAYDIYCSENFLLMPGRNKVPTGIHLQFGSEYEALIDARSGFSLFGLEVYHPSDFCFDRPLRIDADVIQGKCDCDFTGAYSVIVKSLESGPYVIRKGTRIAQMTFVPRKEARFRIVQNLKETERADGGFGHSKTT